MKTMEPQNNRIWPLNMADVNSTLVDDNHRVHTRIWAARWERKSQVEFSWDTVMFATILKVRTIFEYHVILIFAFLVMYLLLVRSSQNQSGFCLPRSRLRQFWASIGVPWFPKQMTLLLFTIYWILRFLGLEVFLISSRKKMRTSFSKA